MLYSPDVCNCTMPYVPRTVPAYAVRDPAYTAEVFALTLVEIYVDELVFSVYRQTFQQGRPFHFVSTFLHTFTRGNLLNRNDTADQ